MALSLGSHRVAVSHRPGPVQFGLSSTDDPGTDWIRAVVAAAIAWPALTPQFYREYQRMTAESGMEQPGPRAEPARRRGSE